MKDLTVIQAKRFGTITCTPETHLIEAARMMVAEDISGLVVTDQQEVLKGIITRSDFLRAYASGPEWKDLPVADFMTTNVVTVSPHDFISSVAHLLLEKQIHRVVIVQKEQDKFHPVGVISDSDIIYHMTKEA
jgi:CBS domain-containing protein